MGKFNTFRPLKQLPGVRQITDVTAYKKAPEALTGGGLCAAMSMRWLADDTLPTTDAGMRIAKSLQTAYENKLEETGKNMTKTMAFLADRCGLALQGRVPTGLPEEAKKFWTKRFGAGGELASNRYSSVIAAAISAYANEKLNDQISWETVGARDTQDLLPCYIWVQIHCPQITLLGRTLTQSPKSVPFVKGRDKYDVVFNYEKLEVDGELITTFGGPHAFALGRGTGGGYVYFDPNVGVYAMAGGLGTFLDTVYQCYEKFNASSQEGWAENDLEAADLDMQLVRIYPVQPSA